MQCLKCIFYPKCRDASLDHQDCRTFINRNNYILKNQIATIIVEELDTFLRKYERLVQNPERPSYYNLHYYQPLITAYSFSHEKVNDFYAAIRNKYKVKSNENN